MKILERIDLRPAVPEKEQSETYLFRAEDKSIVLYNCGLDTYLLDAAVQVLPEWVSGKEDPKGALDAWTFDWNTPEDCLLMGISGEVLEEVFSILEEGVVIVRNLMHTLARHRGSEHGLLSEEDDADIDRIRGEVLDRVWAELKALLVYDPEVAKSRRDRQRSEKLRQVDRELEQLNSRVSKCLAEKQRLLSSGVAAHGEKCIDSGEEEVADHVRRKTDWSQFN